MVVHGAFRSVFLKQGSVEHRYTVRGYERNSEIDYFEVPQKVLNVRRIIARIFIRQLEIFYSCSQRAE
jgi:hypothetical protein